MTRGLSRRDDLIASAVIVVVGVATLLILAVAFIEELR